MLHKKLIRFAVLVAKAELSGRTFVPVAYLTLYGMTSDRLCQEDFITRAMASGIVNEVLCTKYHVLPSFAVILCILKQVFVS